MTIAVHIALPELSNDISSDFNYRCFTILAEKHPENHYIFIFDKEISSLVISQKNITPVLAGPQIKNRLLQYYFYNFKIPRILIKYNADYFVSAEVCSLRTKIPQCLIIKDLSFLNKKNRYSKADVRYLKKYTPIFVNRSANMVVLNPSLKPAMLRSFNVNESKIHCLNIGIDRNSDNFSMEEAERTRDLYTEGKSYFLCFSTATTSANIITALKAFSIFKKWQRSNMQLVVLSLNSENNNIKELSNYKYKSDVKILNVKSGEMENALIASAYAAIYLPAMDITETAGLKVLASGVPLITINNDFQNSFYKDAALYSNPEEKELSEKMMMLYKDENGRNELINKGRSIIKSYSWQHSAESLMQIIQPLTAL